MIPYTCSLDLFLDFFFFGFLLILPSCSKPRSIFPMQKKKKGKFLTDFDCIKKNIVTPDVIYCHRMQINRWKTYIISTILNSKKYLTDYVNGYYIIMFVGA